MQIRKKLKSISIVFKSVRNDLHPMSGNEMVMNYFLMIYVIIKKLVIQIHFFEQISNFTLFLLISLNTKIEFWNFVGQIQLHKQIMVYFYQFSQMVHIIMKRKMEISTHFVYFKRTIQNTPNIIRKVVFDFFILICNRSFFRIFLQNFPFLIDFEFRNVNIYLMVSEIVQ